MKEELTLTRMRIDKWLWAMRIFKTRTLASTQCDLNKICISDLPVKPSRLIKVRDKIQVKRTGFTRTIEVLQLSENRLPAKSVSEFYKDHTPKEEVDAWKARVAKALSWRAPGAGRPSKKDKRDLDDFFEAMDDLI